MLEYWARVNSSSLLLRFLFYTSKVSHSWDDRTDAVSTKQSTRLCKLLMSIRAVFFHAQLSLNYSPIDSRLGVPLRFLYFYASKCFAFRSPISHRNINSCSLASQTADDKNKFTIGPAKDKSQQTRFVFWREEKKTLNSLQSWHTFARYWLPVHCPARH
jgi:hypothetical protein